MTKRKRQRDFESRAGEFTDTYQEGRMVVSWGVVTFAWGVRMEVGLRHMVCGCRGWPLKGRTV